MFIVIKVGSSVCPQIQNPRDVEYILVYKDGFDYTDVSKNYKQSKTSVWSYEEKVYEEYLKRVSNYLWSYQTKFFKVVEGNLNHFPKIQRFLVENSILDPSWWNINKECFSIKYNKLLSGEKTKLLYHYFYIMYIIKNNSYENFSPHQEKIINLAHDKEEIPKEDLQELWEFIL